MRRCLACARTFTGERWRCPWCDWVPDLREGLPAFAPEYVEGGVGEGGFEIEAFENLSRLEEASFWFRARNALILWALDSYAPRAASFMEVGCGTGFVLEAISHARPGMRLVGAELFTAGLRHAARRVPQAELMQMDARQIPYEEEFGAIGAFDVLEHIDDDGRALAACRGALRPGGTLLVTVPQHPSLWSASDEYAHHVRRYTRQDLASRLENAGLRPVRVTSFVTLLLPLMAVSRLVERRRHGQYDPRREHNRSSRLHRPLAAAMQAERALIRRGVSLPVGGSLLAVALRG